MRTWVKLLLALVGTGILGALVLVGGATWWFRSHKDGLVKDGSAAQEAGARYGATHSKEECVGEGLRKLDECGTLGLMCETMNNLRLASCLAASKGPDDLCAGVPSKGDILKSVAWLNADCARRGRRGSSPCSRMMQTVLHSCSRE